MLREKWPSFSCSRRRKPSEPTATDLEPSQAAEPEEDFTTHQTADEPEEREHVLVDPGADPRAEITLIAETRVYYGLVGLTPQEVG